MKPFQARHRRRRMNKRLVKKIAAALPAATDVRIDRDRRSQRWYVIADTPSRRPGVVVFGSFATRTDAEAALSEAGWETAA